MTDLTPAELMDDDRALFGEEFLEEPTMMTQDEIEALETAAHKYRFANNEIERMLCEAARTALALHQELADAKAAQALVVERAAHAAYVACAQTRHVTLGREAEAAIRDLADPSGVAALAALRAAAKAANEHWLAKLDAEAERDALAAKLAAAEARVGALRETAQDHLTKLRDWLMQQGGERALASLAAEKRLEDCLAALTTPAEETKG